MTWKANPNCVNCGERKRFHSSGRCRYEQNGWIPVTSKLPREGEIVLARRGSETFSAMWKFSREINRIVREWVTPYRVDGKLVHGIVCGVTDWRPLRSREPRIESRSRIT